jgi:hypothetical protein
MMYKLCIIYLNYCLKCSLIPPPAGLIHPPCLEPLERWEKETNKNVVSAHFDSISVDDIGQGVSALTKNHLRLCTRVYTPGIPRGK